MRTSRLFMGMSGVAVQSDVAVPDASEWHAEPARVFDHLYFLGTQSF
jgi:hypothetical protein